jgi:clathrin light chain B
MSGEFSTDEVQDFLSREQENLAGLDDEFSGSLPTNNYTEAATADADAQDGFDFGFNQDPGMDGELEQPGSLPSSEPHSMDPYSAVSQADTRRAEPDSIRKWREEQTQRLAEQDTKEEQEMQQWKDQAKHELDEWYKQYNEQMSKNKDNNKIAEEELLNSRQTFNTDDGASWERISNMCDFNHKNFKATKDVSRMRALLINLKQHPPANAAPTPA